LCSKVKSRHFSLFTVLTSWIVTLGTTVTIVLDNRGISWGVKVVGGVFTSLEVILVLVEDIDGSLDCLDSLISILESSIIRSDGISELSLSLLKEFSVELDLLLKGVLLVFVGG